MYNFADNIVTVLAKTVTKLKDLIFRAADLDMIYLSFEKLTSGKLPDYLVSQKILQQELHGLERQLINTHPNLTILHKRLHYYYNDNRNTDRLCLRNDSITVTVAQLCYCDTISGPTGASSYLSHCKNY